MTTAELEQVKQLVLKQTARCRKPHFSSGPYRDRQRIEDWNDGVASLSRETLAALAALPVTPDGA